MAENNAVVGVHNPHAETEAIIKEFQRSGFDNKLSIVGKDYHTQQRVAQATDLCRESAAAAGGLK